MYYTYLINTIYCKCMLGLLGDAFVFDLCNFFEFMKFKINKQETLCFKVNKWIALCFQKLYIIINCRYFNEILERRNKI